MIFYIKEYDEFLLQKKRLNQLVKLNTNLPEQSFHNDFLFFLAFESDFLYNTFFLNGLKNLMKKEGLNFITYFTIDPSPENYFNRYFDRYSVGLIGHNSSDDDFNDFLMRDPGSGPADALVNSNKIALFANSNKWAIIIDKNLELGIVGFTGKDVKKIFIDSFGENKDIFYSIYDFVTLFSFKNDVKNELIKNYSNHL